MLLLAANGSATKAIAATLWLSASTVSRYRARVGSGKLTPAALVAGRRLGRPATISDDARAVVASIIGEPPGGDRFAGLSLDDLASALREHPIGAQPSRASIHRMVCRFDEQMLAAVLDKVRSMGKYDHLRARSHRFNVDLVSDGRARIRFMLLTRCRFGVAVRAADGWECVPIAGALWPVIEATVAAYGQLLQPEGD